MSEHVMIDLETLGKGSHAAIWTIGAVKFNPMHCDPRPSMVGGND